MEVDLDANNNSTDKKGYSLRPRCAPKTTDTEEVVEEVRKPRGRTLKPSKQKGLPLSKYRRKTANARERSRMREINEAFETLRRSIPLISTKCDNPNEKNTKISTLRLAMKYITVLSSALKDCDGESDKDSIFSDYCLTPPDYRDSYTPTSTSDNSDFSDSFLVPNFSQESSSSSLSPISSSSSFNLSDITIKSRVPSWNSSEKSVFGCIKTSDIGSSNESQHQSRTTVSSFSESFLSQRPKPPPTYEMSRIPSPEISQTLRPHSSYTPLSSLETDFRFTNLIPISVQLQSTPVLEDWDDINISNDFDDLLCA